MFPVGKKVVTCHISLFSYYKRYGSFVIGFLHLIPHTVFICVNVPEFDIHDPYNGFIAFLVAFLVWITLNEVEGISSVYFNALKR